MDSFGISMRTLGGNVQIVTNAIGGAFLAVLKPLIDGLNAAVGVTQALPKPVRDLAGAFAAAGIAAAGSVIAIGIFKVALAGLKLEAVVASITGVVVALKANLAGAATVAIVAVGKLTAGLKALSAVTVTQALTPLVAALKVGLAGAASLATAAITALKTALTVANIKAFTASIGAAVVAFGPLLAAIGAVVALVKTWEYVLGGQAAASKEFEDSNKAISEALAKVGADLDEVSKKAQEARGPLDGLGNIFREAREGWTLLRLADEANKLDQGFDQLFNSAVKFFNELKNSSSITEEQRKKAQEYIAELSKVSDAYKKQSERAKELAVEQARLGNQDLAKFYESQAKSLASNAQALDNLVQGTEKQIGVEGSLKNAVEQTAEAQEKAKEALQARADAEAELNRVIAEAPVRQADAQLALGTQLVGIAKALADAEQSRFAVVKSGLQFELQGLEKRGASEQVLAAKKAEIAAADQAALSARYRAVTQQQAAMVAREAALEHRLSELETQARIASVRSRDDKASREWWKEKSAAVVVGSLVATVAVLLGYIL
jgi:hypothetical protein